MLANGNFALLPAVSHNLHCIVSASSYSLFLCHGVRVPLIFFFFSKRRLRQSMYESHYYPNLTRAQTDAYRHHTRKPSSLGPFRFS